MWLSYEKIDEFGLQYAESLGRALVLAQSFEQNCKYVLLIANLDDEVGSGRIKDINGIKKYSDQLDEWFKLGGAVTQFKKRHQIQEADVNMLRKGNEARNYIAHEAAYSLLCGSKATQEIHTVMEIFKGHVDHLAKAENLISQWCFMIQEKSNPPISITHIFSNGVFEWVIEPLGEVGW